MTGRTAAAWKAAFLVGAAQRRGWAPADTCARYGLDPARLAEPDGRVPLAQLHRMWEELPGLLGAPDLPLDVLAVAASADPPLPVWLFLAAPTLGEALRRMARYERVGIDVADGPVARLRVRGGHAVLDLGGAAPPAGLVAQTAAAMVALARRATGAPVGAAEVWLRYPAPPRSAAWEAAFGVAPRFGAPRDRLVLRRADLARPHPGASRTLSALAERHAAALLDALPVGADPSAEVRHVLRAAPGADLGAVAEALGTSPRTLQRRLAGAGARWRDVVDAERRDAALAGLASDRPLAEVAFDAGFADPSTFGRAVRRWTGRPPAAWRAARRAQPAAPAAETPAADPWERPGP